MLCSVDGRFFCLIVVCGTVVPTRRTNTPDVSGLVLAVAISAAGAFVGGLLSSSTYSVTSKVAPHHIVRQSKQAPLIVTDE